MAHPKLVRFIPTNPDKYIGDITNIVLRSSWEVKFAKWADQNNSVLKWGSELAIIPYYSTVDQKWRRYFVDFVLKIQKSDGTIQNIIAEIKPAKETKPPKRSRNKKTFIKESITWQVNQDKWSAAKKWADNIGFTFTILTEKELGLQTKGKTN